MIDLLADLNTAQKTAVTHREGPLMILAGAGTGKTTVVTRRIAWLIQEGLAKSGEILALTFTEKASGEMEERVDQLLPMGYLDLSIHTFHAFCEKLLREHGMEIGLTRDFEVFTELDGWLLMRRAFERFELEHYRPLGNPTRYLRGLLRHFASLKEEQIWPEDYLTFVEKEENEESEKKRLGELARAYQTYETILHEANALDFGGLILYTLKLLKERPEVLKHLQEKYRYLLVDEFQDTNTAQYELVQLLAKPRNNLTVVGDDDQSIYQFRGASLSNILRFDEDYKETHHVVLTTNYRSHQEILDASYAFIQNNNPARLEIKTGLSKKLIAEKSEGGTVRHLHYPSLEDEVEGVLKMVLEAKASDPTLQWKDIGILVRANDHAEPFVERFEQQGVPYQFLAMRGLYTKPVVLDLLAWMRFIDDPFDAMSAYRVLAHPLRALPTPDLERILYATRKQGKPVLDLDVALIEDLSEEAKGILDHVKATQQELADLARRKRATEMLVFTARNTGLVEYLNTLPEATAREAFALLQQLYARIKQFETRNDERSLHHFLEEFAFERDAGETGALEFDIETGPDTVRVMTVHGSKGLEFRHVFVVNLVDRRFPSQHRADAIPVPDALITKTEKGEHLEEERRLLYVAMTRAKERLYLTSAEDYGGARKKKLSLFLHELGFSTSLPSVSSEPKDPQALFIEEPERVKTTPLVFEIPKPFSFTQYQAYRTCPLQYKFAHLFHIPVTGKYQMSFGKTLHGALQVFFEDWLKTSTLPSLESLLELYAEAWIDDWYPNDTEREAYRTRGVTSLKTFYENLLSHPPKPFAVEQAFTLKLGSAILKGQIDRVDELDGGLHLIDYKTGSPKTFEDLKPEQKDQLYIYQMAAEEIWQRPVRRLTYLYLEGNQTVDFLGTEKDLERVSLRVEEVLQSIGEGDFEPTPGFHCSFCDFREICPFRAE